MKVSVKILIEKYTTQQLLLDSVNNIGYTAFMILCKFCSESIIKIFIEKYTGSQLSVDAVNNGL